MISFLTLTEDELLELFEAELTGLREEVESTQQSPFIFDIGISSICEHSADIIS